MKPNPDVDRARLNPRCLCSTAGLTITLTLSSCSTGGHNAPPLDVNAYNYAGEPAGTVWHYEIHTAGDANPGSLTITDTSIRTSGPNKIVTQTQISTSAQSPSLTRSLIVRPDGSEIVPLDAITLPETQLRQISGQDVFPGAAAINAHQTITNSVYVRLSTSRSSRSVVYNISVTSLGVHPVQTPAGRFSNAYEIEQTTQDPTDGYDIVIDTYISPHIGPVARIITYSPNMRLPAITELLLSTTAHT